MNLNWNTNVYSLHLEADGVFQVFDIKADLVFAEGKDIVLLAEADIVVPSWVPFIGGDTLAGLGFFFEHVWAHDSIPTSTTFAAWLDFDLFTEITVGFEVVFDASGTATWSLISGTEVAGFRQALDPSSNQPQTWTYQTNLSNNQSTGLPPDGTTSLMAKVDWSHVAPGVSIGTPRLRVLHNVNGQTVPITEDQFAANGIKVIDDARLTSSTSKVIQITNNNPSDPYAPLQGTYTLYVDVDAEGGNPFPSFPGTSSVGDDLDIRVIAQSANPIFGNVGATTPYQLLLPTTTPTGTFKVSVAGNADENYLEQGEVSVSLYRISSADPFRRPVLIEKRLATQTDPDGVTAPLSAFTATFQVPIDGLAPNAYTLIAVVDDGVNPPVSTDPSPEFTPVFAVQGTVTNQNGTPILGQTVFLDYNRNGVQDANEPGTTTGPNGYAFTDAFDSNPNLDKVPSGSPFDVVLSSLSNSVPDSGYEFQDVTNESGAFKYSPTVSPWTFTSAQIPGDGAGLVANNSDFGNANAPEGNQVAFLQQQGSISQTVTLAAGTHSISFMAAQRPGNKQTFQVWVRDSSGSSFQVGSFQPTDTSYQTYTTDSFPVAAGSYTIEFLGTNTNTDNNNGDNTAFLDAVRCDKLDHFDPVAASRVTFDGTHTVNQPFALKENVAIKGVVYDDTDSNGNPAAGLPVGGALAYLDTNGNGLRDPGEPTALTNASGVYSFSGLAAGTYTVRVDMTTVGHITPAEAYVVPAGTAGTDQGSAAGQNTYGMAFTTDRPVVLTSLGVFDDNSDGLTTTLTAVLYDDTTKVELARLTFTPQNPGTLVGGTRYLDLPRPITLPAGFKGMIAAYGFGATTDRAGRNFTYRDSTSTPWTTDGGAGRLDFTGGYLANTPNTYPTIAERIEIDAGAFRQVFGLPNPYAAGSFQYRDVPWAPSPSSATSHQVTLDASATELVEGQNFGLLPPTIFFGQVTGQPLVNGKTQPQAPQSGVPVTLLADRVVLAVDSGGGGGSGFTGDQYVTNGTELPPATAPHIDTSGVPGAPAEDIYRTARVGNVNDAGDGGFTYTLEGLSPGSIYTVRLHFAEIQDKFEVPNQRKFNVSINGTQVLFDFDIVAAAGGPNTAIARDFQATAGPNGQIIVAFTTGSANAPLVNAIQILAPVRDVQTPAKLAIDSGGDGTGNFVADQYVTGGSTAAWWGVIDMGPVWDGAPEPVYHTLRIGDPSSGDRITYTLPEFEPGRAYTVRLHFADFGVAGPGQRKFNVDINNHRVLTDFDVAAAAGQPWEIAYSYAQFFDAVADENGRIVIDFTKGSVGEPIVSGIEVFEPTNVVDTTTTDAQGNYALVAYGAGQYTVIQQPPTGWEQVAPTYGNPAFTSTTPTVEWTAAPIYSNNSAVTSADLNGDGRMDLVVTSIQPGSPWPGTYDTLSVSVLYNQPDGSFHVVQNHDFVAYTNSVPLLAVGDFNGDHRPDLAYVYSGLLFPAAGAPTGTYLNLFLNTGNSAEPFANFRDPAPNPIKVQPDVGSGEFYSAIASGDIDGDGNDDLVVGLSRALGQEANWFFISEVTSPTPNSEKRGTTPGGWSPTYAINKIAIVDVDGNGYKDVLVTAVESYPPSFHTLPYSLGPSVVGVWSRKDANSWLGYSHYSDGHGPITGLAVGPMRTGELPNWYTAAPNWLYFDGSPDRLPTSGGNIPIYQAGINNGDGTFDWRVPPSWNNEEAQPKDQNANFHLVSGLRLRDMNGDTLPDLVYLYGPSTSTQAIAIRLNTGDGFDLTGPPSILVPLPSNLSDYVSDFEVADFDGDGLNDVFVAGTDQSPGMLFRNGTAQNKPGVSLFAAAGSWQTGLDFQSVQVPVKSAVRGQVREDVHGDGTRNTGDKGLAGAVVFADLNRNRTLDAGEPQATTTATGHYTLPGLADGTYSVGILPDADWKTTPTGGEFTEVTIANGSVERADFARTRRLIGAVPSQTVAANGSLDVTVPRTAAAAGHRLVYSLEGTVPAGMTIDSATGELMWTPTAADAGTHTVTVRVRDPLDTRVTDTREVTIDVTARTPVPAVGVTSQDPYPVFVRTLYRDVLKRLPRPAELNRWVRFLRFGGSRVAVAVALVTSPAYRRKHPNAASFVRSLYRDVLGRRPDPRGVAAWVGSAQANGGDWGALAKAILGTPAGRQELRERFDEAALVGG